MTEKKTWIQVISFNYNARSTHNNNTDTSIFGLHQQLGLHHFYTN